MNLNSRLFDRIRVKPEQKQAARPDLPPCDHPGCCLSGEFRAPMGRLREGEYFCFCLEHVREYNASYNYFNGMSAEAVARYQRDAVVGHRPTWAMGTKRSDTGAAADRDNPSRADDPFGMYQRTAQHYSCDAPRQPRYGIAAVQALSQLGLDDSADPDTIRTRYKDLVKRLHPDANGGDRSNEAKLREIIRAYHYLRTVRPA
jgi:curved DNA-binding protein CbpA